MSQPLKVAGFEVIISGRFWVITKGQIIGLSLNVSHITSLEIERVQLFVINLP